MKTLNKLNFFLIGICLLVFALSTTIAGEIYKKVLFDNTYQTLSGSLRQMGYNISEKRERFLASVTQLLSGKAIKDLAYEGMPPGAASYEKINAFNEEARKILYYDPSIASVLYINQDNTAVGTDGKTVWKEEADERLVGKLADLTGQAVFLGGFDSSLFYGNKGYLKAPFENYITAAVPCRFAPVPSKEGWLLVNVRENAFRTVFFQAMEEADGDIYVIDQGGMILSSTDGTQISQKYGLWEKIRNGEPDDYYTDREIYSIACQIPASDWWIVWEKPVDTFYGQAMQLHRILLFCVAVSLIVVFSGYGLYARMLLKPLHVLTEAMRSVGKGSYGIRIEEKADGDIGRVIESFNAMSQNIALLEGENLRINNEKRTLQLLALREQMSPHFVLNALNTIKWMAMLNREENIANMVIALSKTMQAFKNTSAFGTIGEEIDFIRNYIAVMNYRYGDVIHVHYEVERELEPVSIPIFFIQPLVENALKHGFASTNCKGDIHISVFHEDNILKIQVRDNGSGLSLQETDDLNRKLHITNRMSLVDTGGVGLMNIARRIQLYYGEPYGIRIDSRDGTGVMAMLTLPYCAEIGDKHETNP